MRQTASLLSYTFILARPHKLINLWDLTMTKEFYIVSTAYNIQERVTATKGKVYDIYFRIINKDGKEKLKKMCGFKTKALAKAAYTDFVATKCEPLKEKPARAKDSSKEDLMLEPLINEYLTSLFNQNKDSTIYNKKHIYQKFVLSYFGNCKMRELTADALYRWQDFVWRMINDRTGEYYSNKYLINLRAHFMTFLSWCESRYNIPNNYAKVKCPARRATKKIMSIWTREQFEQFIAVVDSPLYHALFTLMFYTGRRKGEIFALTPQDIKGESIIFDKSLTRKTFGDSTYNITTTKEDKVQVVPVCKRVQRELQAYSGGSPFYFGGSKPLADNTVRRAFRDYCDKAGVPPIRIHDLRHSFVSMLIHLGANFMVIADLIGDTVEQVTKTYGHLYESDKRILLDKLG